MDRAVIYFDNAATTMTKPERVTQALLSALVSFGGAGRGVHPASLAAGRAVFEARERIASLLDAPSSSAVSFALNATMALNIALQGLVKPGSTVLTTAASHNSVLRPLFRLRDELGCKVEIVPILPDGSLDYGVYERMLSKSNCALVAVTHASNVTGDVYDIARMARAAHASGALFVLDAAQTAGSYPLSMKDLGVDVLCFTGHKSLFGPQGTGGLCVNPSVEIHPLVEGGSGVHSFDERQPSFMPEALEAGTLNAHGLAGLAAGVAFLQEVGVDNIHRRLSALTDRFEQGLCTCQDVEIVGGHNSFGRCGIVAVRAKGKDSSMLADKLAQDFGICTRAGAHCAPLMHKSLKTEASGVVRFSFSYFNTEEEIDQGINALRSCLENL